MESQTPPFKISRLANSGIGPTSWNTSWGTNMKANGSIEGDGSPPVGLNLELGRGSNHSRKSSGFTIFQLQELQIQVLIYKYIEVGLPVPYHLVLSIWKSVPNSLPVPPGYPGFMVCNPFTWEYKNRKEPEPGRCRRTDGKKWRCRKEVVPHKNYCERHVHRGRSRKHVEEASQSSTANTNLSISLSMNTSNNGNLSPRLGFSPKSVLHGGTLKTEVTEPSL